jgi:hypothetical protein
MSPHQFMRWLLRTAVVCLLLAGTLGCKPDSPKTPEPMILGITGYNYTDEGVQEYYVNDKRGSNLPAYGGGGSLSCCVSLPVQWNHELSVEVSWITGHWTVPIEKIQAMSTKEAIECCLDRRALSKTVSIEPYGKEGGDVQVFFLPNDELQVWVYDAGPQNPGHPSHRGYPKKPDATN